MSDHACLATVMCDGGWRSRSCGKPAKHDPINGVPTRCGLHSSERGKRIAEKREARWKEEQARMDKRRDEANERNRRLAAFDDLLAACKAALAHSIERSEGRTKWTVADQRVHETLAAAIALAEAKP